MRIVKELMEIWLNEVCDKKDILTKMRLEFSQLLGLLYIYTQISPHVSLDISASYLCYTCVIPMLYLL